MVILVGIVTLGSSCSGLEAPATTPLQDNEARKPFDSAPTWSPDGERIAFTRGADETLRLLDVRSGRMTVVSEGVLYGGDALWSADGQRLAYVRDSDRTLLVADVRTRRSTELLDDVTGLGRRAWSPDQRLLAVASKRDKTESKRCFGIEATCTELYVVDVRRGTRRRLTDNLTYEQDPVWSPDAKKIAILSGHNPGNLHDWRDVRVVSLGGGSDRLVTDDGRVERWAEWKTSDSLLIEVDDGSRFELSLAINRRRDLPSAKQDAYGVVRSTLDGTLAYESIRDRNGRTCWEGSGGSDGPGCYTNAELYLRLPSGRRLRITHSRVEETDLVWSPDGRTLAFQSGGKLMLVDHDGKNLRAMIKGA
jgi:Tol biopolymer transport system component